MTDQPTPPKATATPQAHRCAYVARQVALKAKYQLWVTAAERDAIEGILQTCPAQKLPTATDIALGGGTVITVTPKTTSATPTKDPGNLDPQFGTCREANDAGYGPYDAGKDPNTTGTKTATATASSARGNAKRHAGVAPGVSA